MQAPETGTEAELFTAVQGIMEASAQSLRLTRLSGRRDMSTLLAQSAFSVMLACTGRYHISCVFFTVCTTSRQLCALKNGSKSAG